MSAACVTNMSHGAGSGKLNGKAEIICKTGVKVFWWPFEDDGLAITRIDSIKLYNCALYAPREPGACAHDYNKSDPE